MLTFEQCCLLERTHAQIATRNLRATAGPLYPADACDSELEVDIVYSSRFVRVILEVDIDAAIAKNVTTEDIRFYGTATMNPQQPAAKAPCKRRQQGRKREAPNAFLDDLLKDYDKHNRELIAIRVPP